MVSVQWMGTGVAADIYTAGRLLCWQERHNRGLGVMCKVISVFSRFFIWDHGVGGSRSLWHFRVVLTSSVKGIQVSRAIMTLETKGALLTLCSALETHYVLGILQCLPIETAEVEGGASVCGSS